MTRTTLMGAILLLAMGACAPEPAAEAAATEAAATEAAATEAEVPEAAPETEEAAAEPSSAPETFGATLSDRTLTELQAITANPEQYAGQVVKTEGEIAQVCQRMGCWMEMRTEGADGAQAVRVPMAGHDFFLPRDSAGRRATIEGQVAIRELSDAEREHLASEGAQAVTNTLQISATGVVLH